MQEFRVSTNNVSAEFGGYGGGVIQIATKSGTNKLHGNAYEYFRNTALNANNWLSNHNGLGKSPPHQNQYGGDFAGPIFKDKAFFFLVYERESLTSSYPTSIVSPTSKEIAGDFSSGEQVIYDPLTGMPFAANKIPTNRLDATALKILALETPNQNRVTQTPLVNNAFASAPIAGYQNQYNARVDYALGSKDNVFAKYVFWNPHNSPSGPFGTRTGLGVTGTRPQKASWAILTFSMQRPPLIFVCLTSTTSIFRVRFRSATISPRLPQRMVPCRPKRKASELILPLEFRGTV